MQLYYSDVIPAQAGIQRLGAARWRKRLVRRGCKSSTGPAGDSLDSRLRGNDGHDYPSTERLNLQEFNGLN